MPGIRLWYLATSPTSRMPIYPKWGRIVNLLYINDLFFPLHHPVGEAYYAVKWGQGGGISTENRFTSMNAIYPFPA